jgi:hypothetical protein
MHLLVHCCRWRSSLLALLMTLLPTFRSNTVNPALLYLDCGGMMVVHIVMSALSPTACKQFVPAQVLFLQQVCNFGHACIVSY